MIRESEAIGQKVFTAPVLSVGRMFVGARVPDVNDDWTAGFNRGSFWQALSRLWVQVDDTEGVAVWREIPLMISRAARVIFEEHVTVATTLTADYEDLYSHDVVGVLTTDGDVLRVQYAGTFNPSTDVKRVRVQVDTTEISPPFTTNLAVSDAWLLDMYLIRVNSTTLRWAFRATSPGQNVMVQVFDFGADPTNLTIKLRAQSVTTIGDIEAHSCYGMFLPSPDDGTSGAMEFLGTGMEFLGDEIMFTP
jgi:hypothetical protein